MRKVIDGKIYDTETATKIFEYENCHDPGNAKYVSKTLYRTPNECWFVREFGGGLSEIAQVYADGSSGPGSSIEVLSDDAACAFLQEHSGDSAAFAAIETYFADKVVAG